jgi:hypothetical protein
MLRVVLIAILLAFAGLPVKANTVKNFLYAYCNESRTCFEVKSPEAKKSVLQDTYFLSKASVKVFKDRNLVSSYNLENYLLNNSKKLMFKPGSKLINMN